MRNRANKLGICTCYRKCITMGSEEDKQGESSLKGKIVNPKPEGMKHYSNSLEMSEPSASSEGRLVPRRDGALFASA